MGCDTRDTKTATTPAGRSGSKAKTRACRIRFAFLETPCGATAGMAAAPQDRAPVYGAGQPSLSARSTRAWNSSAARANSCTGWTVTASAGLAATGTLNSR